MNGNRKHDYLILCCANNSLPPLQLILLSRIFGDHANDSDSDDEVTGSDDPSSDGPEDLMKKLRAAAAAERQAENQRSLDAARDLLNARLQSSHPSHGRPAGATVSSSTTGRTRR